MVGNESRFPPVPVHFPLVQAGGGRSHYPETIDADRRGRDYAGRAARAADNSRGADGRRVPRHGQRACRGRNLGRRRPEQQLERWRQLDFEPATCGAGRNGDVRAVVKNDHRVGECWQHRNRQHHFRPDRTGLYDRDRCRAGLSVNGSGAGGGVSNNSSFSPNFLVSGAGSGLAFFNNAGLVSFTPADLNTPASPAIIITNGTAGTTSFYNNSSASTPNNGPLSIFSTKINNNSGGTTQFFQNSTANFAYISNKGNGSILFFDTSTAGRATLENAAGGEVRFSDSSTAGGAIIQNFFGSTTNFFGTATAGNATIVNGFQGIGT